MKKLLSLILSVLLALLPALGAAEELTEELAEEPADAARYVYKDAVSALPARWNPHTAQTGEERYPLQFLEDSLYTVLFNDALHPIEGKAPYAGFVIVPEMAASEPVDVTKRVKAEHPEFGIPEAAEKGWAYTIDLNPDCVWEDGTPIDADTYVYSMERLLDPKLRNSRAADYYDGDFSIAGAEAFARAGQTLMVDNGVNLEYSMENLVKDEDGAYVTEEGFPAYLAVDYALKWTMGHSLKEYVDAYGETYFSMTHCLYA